MDGGGACRGVQIVIGIDLEGDFGLTKTLPAPKQLRLAHVGSFICGQDGMAALGRGLALALWGYEGAGLWGCAYHVEVVPHENDHLDGTGLGGSV